MPRARSSPYARPVPGAAVGTVTLEIPSLDGQDVALGGGTWLEAPGGAPDGYLRYADDAFAVDFTLPAAIDVDAATPAVLPGSAGPGRNAARCRPGDRRGLGRRALARLRERTGVAGDSGGGDCSFKPFIAADAGAAPPGRCDECRAAQPPPPPPPPPPPRGGGGQGASLLLMLAGLLLILWKRGLAQRDRESTPIQASLDSRPLGPGRHPGGGIYADRHRRAVARDSAGLRHGGLAAVRDRARRRAALGPARVARDRQRAPSSSTSPSP